MFSIFTLATCYMFVETDTKVEPYHLKLSFLTRVWVELEPASGLDSFALLRSMTLFHLYQIGNQQFEIIHKKYGRSNYDAIYLEYTTYKSRMSKHGRLILLTAYFIITYKSKKPNANWIYSFLFSLIFGCSCDMCSK